MSEPKEMAVGIDVAKAALDVAVRPSGEERHLANDAAGIADIVGWMQAISPQVIVVEATGGYEAPLVAELGIAHLPVAVVNPRQVRDFAKATGTPGEDRSAGCAGAGPFWPGRAPDPAPIARRGGPSVGGARGARRQVVAMRTAEENRLGATRVALVRTRIQAHLQWLETDLREVDDDLRLRLRASPLWREQDDLLQSVPGIGPILSLTLLAELARTGTALPRADRRARRGRSAQPRQRHTARPSRRLGWPTGCAHGALHGHLARHALQSRHPAVLRPPPGGRQGEEGRVGGVHAQTVDHPQRDGQTPDSLAGSGRLSLPAGRHPRHSCSSLAR